MSELPRAFEFHRATQRTEDGKTEIEQFHDLAIVCKEQNKPVAMSADSIVAISAECDALQLEAEFWKESADNFSQWVDDVRIQNDALRKQLDVVKEALAFALPELRMFYKEFEAKRDMELLINNNEMRNPEYINIRIEQINTAIKVANEALQKLEEK